jgi:DNA replication and repair protein RecF
LHILALVLDGVRNLAPLQLEPRERFNVFVGDNGQGKTNLLEAIYAVATLRSFRTAKLAEMIGFGNDRARLGARVLRQQLTRVYEVEVAPGARRVRLDGKAVRPLSKYFGGFNVVVFTPEDLALPRGSPGDRRRFLDRSVQNLHPSYLALAGDYEQVLKQRNTVLRSADDMGPLRVDELLAIYDQQLADLGVAVAATRAAFVDAIRPALADAFTAITRTGLAANARYATKSTTASDLLAQLREGRARDLATQATHSGPHRDDIVFELDGRDAGSFASQGQLRAIMLAWKTAELTVLGRAQQDLPILLLDDVSSELDAARNEYLFEHLAKLSGQCFITTTHGGHVLLTQDRADYRIQNGQISS